LSAGRASSIKPKILNCNVLWFIYILTCSDGSLYVGHNNDLENRVKSHNLGKGAVFTALRRPLKLSYFEVYGTKEETLKREKQLKKWSRAKKLALIKGNIEKLKTLVKKHC
jgi:putative endonuclease